MKIRILFLMVCLNIQGYSTLGAFDLPSMYRASFFQSEPTDRVDDWRPTLAVRFATGDTDEAFAHDEDKTKLFNAHGAFNILALGKNLENLASKPATSAYWNDAGTGLFDTIPLKNAVVALKPADGKVVFGGTFKTTEIDIDYKQNLFWGFYFHAYVPFVERKIYNISFKNIGSAEVNGVNIDNFIKNPVGDKLPKILKENGFKITDNKTQTVNVLAPFKESGIGDVVMSIGWQGYKECQKGIIDAFGGFLQIGVLLPTSEKRDEDEIFSVPLGYDDHIGAVFRTAGEVSIWKIVTVGAQAGVIVFGEDKKNLRMQTSNPESLLNQIPPKEPALDQAQRAGFQNGWIVLGKGRAKVDLGQIWDLGGYVKFDQFVDGLAITFGYSYTKQQDTQLQVKDSNFLKTALIRAATVNKQHTLVGSFGREDRFLSKDAIVNNDSRFDGWETQVLHFIGEYCYPGKTFNPFIRFEYDYPIFGKFSWNTDMIGGKLGLSLGFGF